MPSSGGLNIAYELISLILRDEKVEFDSTQSVWGGEKVNSIPLLNLNHWR